MTDRWQRRDLRVSWHPYTQMRECVSDPPLRIVRARGLKLYDARGTWYDDAIASWWSSVHGHCHPAITRAIAAQAKQLDHVLFAGFTHDGAVALAEELLRLAPRQLRRVFFSDDGSTAVEVALKLSLQYWQLTGARRKTKFVALDAAYHGDTAGTMSVGGVSRFTAPFAPLCVPQYRVPAPYCYRCPCRQTYPVCRLACLQPLEKLLRAKHRQIAGLIIEPLICAAGGMIIYPPAYLQGAARLCRQYDVHLIADEVATGFGRTGTMFAVEQARGVRPDFLCLAKGLTGGTLTLGATLTTARVYRAFLGGRDKTFYHGHTFTANPIACAAALASLRLFRTEQTLRRAVKVQRLLRATVPRFRALPLVGDVRVLGSIFVCELVSDKTTKQPPINTVALTRAIRRAGLQRHLALRPLGNLVYLWLPLSATEREVRRILDCLHDILADTRK